VVKKILLIAAIAFVAYYVLHSPQIAGHTVHTAGMSAWHGVREMAGSLTKFFNTLFS